MSRVLNIDLIYVVIVIRLILIFVSTDYFDVSLLKDLVTTKIQFGSSKKDITQFDHTQIISNPSNTL